MAHFAAFHDYRGERRRKRMMEMDWKVAEAVA
jgi:hypothetical protein